MAEYSFDVLADEFTFYRFADDAIPADAFSPGSFFIGAAGDRSLLAPSSVRVRGYIEAEPGWRCLKIREVLAFSAVAIAAEITADLAGEGISVLVMSGYRHDYFFVPAARLDDACMALTRSGHRF